jgi:hypothetical protein
MTRAVKVNVLKTDNHNHRSDLFVEIDDISNRVWKPIAAFASLKAAAKWLEDEGFKYVHGSNGIWINDAPTKGKNAETDSGVPTGEGSTNGQGNTGKQQQACGVRRLTGTLGRLGPTLRSGSGNVAKNQISGRSD